MRSILSILALVLCLGVATSGLAEEGAQAGLESPQLHGGGLDGAAVAV